MRGAPDLLPNLPSILPCGRLHILVLVLYRITPMLDWHDDGVSLAAAAERLGYYLLDRVRTFSHFLLGLADILFGHAE